MSIIDIDFRHVMRAVPDPKLGEGVGRMVPVLQWRKKIKTEYYGQFSGGTWDEWTEWQDVRTEED